MSKSRMRLLAIVAGGILTLTASPAVVMAQEEDPSWKPDPACDPSDPVVQEAIANTIARTGVQTEWYGPTEGPAPQAGAKVVWIPTSAQNALSVNWGKEIEKVSELLGWDYTTIDGKNSACFAGEGLGRVKDIISDLLAGGYDGGFSIEPHLAAVVHLAKEADDPEEAFKLYTEYGRRLVALVEACKG